MPQQCTPFPPPPPPRSQRIIDTEMSRLNRVQASLIEPSLFPSQEATRVLELSRARVAELKLLLKGAEMQHMKKTRASFLADQVAQAARKVETKARADALAQGPV